MSVQIVGTNEAGIARSVECIRSGGVLLYPTETVYGLGGNALKAAVAERVRTLKGSDGSKPMLVLTDEWSRVAEWIDQSNPYVERLRVNATELSATFLIPVSRTAPKHLTGKDGLIGIRRTSDTFCRALIASSDAMLLSTSANKAGGLPPAKFEGVNPEILNGVDVAVNASRSLQGVPSTIVRLDGKAIEVIREGAVDSQTIHEILGMA